MAAGKLTHIAVDQVETGGKDNIDPDKHNHQLGVGVQPARPGESDDQ